MSRYNIEMKPIRGKNVYGKNCIHAYNITLSTPISETRMEFGYQHDEKLKSIVEFVEQMQKYYEDKIEELENG